MYPATLLNKQKSFTCPCNGSSGISDCVVCLFFSFIVCEETQKLSSLIRLRLRPVLSIRSLRSSESACQGTAIVQHLHPSNMAFVS